MRTNKKKINWYPENPVLQQALSAGLEYAFVSKNSKQCCPFVLCKDFLQDAVYNQIYRTKRKIWGFCYNPKIHDPIDTEKIRLVLANSQDCDFREKIPQVLNFINQVEDHLKISKTRVRECSKPALKYRRGGVFYFEGSKRWLSSPVMLSLYTLLLRIGFVHKNGESFEKTMEKVSSGDVFPYQEEDGCKLHDALAGIKKILSVGDRKIFHSEIKKNYPRVRISILHNDMGIVGFSKGYTKSYSPYWHREEITQK